MRTADVVEVTGYSAQQIHDLEAGWAIPPAGRRANGYRVFGEEHLRALRAYRDLARAVGPVEGRRVMRQMRGLADTEAAALVAGLHVRLVGEREQALAAREALLAIRGEADGGVPAGEGDSMTITELAQALGVRASALRFWESVGLVAPQRIETRAGTARRYGQTAIRDARITAALRAGGYRIPDVQAALAAVRGLGDVSGSLEALDHRVAEIGRRMVALLRAGAALAEMTERGA